MGFKVGAKLKVWNIDRFEKYTQMEVSTYRKNGDQFIKDFNSKVRLVGKAHQKATNYTTDDRVVILDCDVTNNYDKEKKIMYTNYAIFDCELAGDGNQNKPSNQSSGQDMGFMSINAFDSDEVPFV